MKNILTFDIEDWNHVNYGSFHSPAQQQRSLAPEGVDTILQLLHKNRTTATFFVLGEVAIQHPTLIKTISQLGHEVACHGLHHVLIARQTPRRWREELRIAKDLLEQLIGLKVTGFRAPSWSITPATEWMLDLILAAGFTYDSSLAGIATRLYGYRGVPDHPFIYRRHKGYLMEIPFSVVEFGGIRLPIGGGTYFRFYPYCLTAAGIHRLNSKKYPAMIFSHPREYVSDQPVLDLSFNERFVHYVNLATVKEKFSRLLKDFFFISIQDYLLECLKKQDYLEAYYTETRSQTYVTFKRLPDVTLDTVTNYPIREIPG